MRTGHLADVMHGQHQDPGRGPRGRVLTQAGHQRALHLQWEGDRAGHHHHHHHHQGPGERVIIIIIIIIIIIRDQVTVVVIIIIIIIRDQVIPWLPTCTPPAGERDIIIIMDQVIIIIIIIIIRDQVIPGYHRAHHLQGKAQSGASSSSSSSSSSGTR